MQISKFYLALNRNVTPIYDVIPSPDEGMKKIPISIVIFIENYYKENKWNSIWRLP